jgi:hypothetical protein
MAFISGSPVPVVTLFKEGGEGAGDASGMGASVAFAVGESVGGAAIDLIPFLEFLGGTLETVTIGGTVVERVVPLRHPYFTDMVAVAARWRRSGKAIDVAPGATDWRIWVDFALVPYQFDGSTPYSVLRRNTSASAITMPGRAFAVSGVKLEHDVARVLPEIAFSATQYNVPTLANTAFTTLVGTVNSLTFLGLAPGTVFFNGVQDEIATTIGLVQNRTVTLSLTWRPVSWQQILLPTGVWAAPININDGLGIYPTADHNALL